MDSSVARRTLVVSGVPDALSPSRMADKLVIHFQRSKNHGGDVQHVQYPTNLKGVAFVTFDRIQGILNTGKIAVEFDPATVVLFSFPSVKVSGLQPEMLCSH